MFDDLRRRDAGPWQCQGCGTRLHAPLMFCPRCGANQLAAASLAQAASEVAPDDDAHTRGFADRLRALCGPVATGLEGGAHYGDDYPPVAYDSIDEDRPVHRSRLPLYAGGVLAVAVFAVAAYVSLTRSGWEPKRGVQITEGAVGGQRETTPPALHGTAPVSADVASGRGPPPAATMAGTETDATQQAAAEPQRTRENDAPDSKPTAVTRQLAIARASLGRNSLWPAHRAITKALAAQPGNDDAQRMQTDLVSRERERDSLLGYARQCARSGQWLCVRQYAGRAQTIDTSSREARRMLVRAAVSMRPAPPPRVGVVQDSSPPNVLERVRRWLEQRVPGKASVRRHPPQLQSWDHP